MKNAVRIRLNILMVTAMVLTTGVRAQTYEVSVLPSLLEQAWIEGWKAPTVKAKPVAKPSSVVSLIHEIAQQEGVNKLFAEAIARVESNLNPKAISHKNCKGLFQLHPITARELGVQNVFDPTENTSGGLRYFKYLIQRFEDVRLALIAWNAGPSVAESVRSSSRRSIPAETRDFVSRVLKTFRDLKQQL